MRYEVRASIVDVIGHIYEPGYPLCSLRYSIGREELERLPPAQDGEITRAVIDQFIRRRCSDFSEIRDWRASFEFGDATVDFDWRDGESSEDAYRETLPEILR